eukprot:Hpha_TRINITY_DN30609_c0_g1::TRINITY_DN30609_c0_g1_i1::g.18331::m.18331
MAGGTVIAFSTELERIRARAVSAEERVHTLSVSPTPPHVSPAPKPPETRPAGIPEARAPEEPSVSALKRALQQEQKRARVAEETAAERLQDIRTLQQQLSRRDRGGSGGTEQSREVEWMEQRLRESQADAAALRLEAADMRRQMGEMEDAHREEVEAWVRQRETAREREEILAIEMRQKENHLSKSQSYRDEYALKRQVQTLTAQLSEMSRVHQLDREQLLTTHREDLAEIRASSLKSTEDLREQLQEERRMGQDRMRAQQQLEKQLADLTDSLAQVPDGIEARTREQQRALESALAAHRADADEATRRHKQIVQDYERQFLSEKRRVEEKDAELRSVQKQMAGLQLQHQVALEEQRREREEAVEKVKAQSEEQENRARDKEVQLNRHLEEERSLTADRLRELQHVQKKMQEQAAAHAQEILRQQDLREQLLKEARIKEDALRRQHDAQIAERDAGAAERERQLLGQREEVLASSLRDNHEREELGRRQQEARVAQLKQRHKEELERRAAEEGKRRQEWEREFRRVAEHAREREEQAQMQSDQATEAAAIARRQVEDMVAEGRTTAHDRQREREEEARRAAVALREAEERAQARQKEMLRASQEAETARLLAQEATQERVKTEQQLAALEQELSRAIDGSVAQQEQLRQMEKAAEQSSRQSNELKAELAAQRARLADVERMLSAKATEAERAEKDKAALAAECQLLHEREERLRSWAHGTVDAHLVAQGAPPSRLP